MAAAAAAAAAAETAAWSPSRCLGLATGWVITARCVEADGSLWLSVGKMKAEHLASPLTPKNKGFRRS